MVRAPQPRRIPRPPGTPVHGGDPLAATGRTLRWGVVSTGGIARTMAAHIATLHDAELHAVSSRSEERALAFAEEFGFTTSYGDAGVPGYRQLAEDAEVDVVYVATPHGSHYDVTRSVLEGGKHALVEKAFTVTASEAERLVALAAERGLFLMEAVWTRFLPVFHRALDLIEEGQLGEVRWVQGNVGFNATGDPRKRLWAPQDGGGALLDLSVYPLTWVLGALGVPDALAARGSLTADGVDAANALTLSYDDGAQAQILSTLTARTTGVVTIGGREGTLHTLGSLTGPEGLVVATGSTAREERFGTRGLRHAYQLREVTRCIQLGLTESPTMPLADTLASMRLFDEARRQLGVVYPNDAATPGVSAGAG
jgi:predicted dehydrogenase